MIPSSEVFRPPRACSSQFPFHFQKIANPRAVSQRARHFPLCILCCHVEKKISRGSDAAAANREAVWYSSGRGLASWGGNVRRGSKCSRRTYIDVADGGASSHFGGIVRGVGRGCGEVVVIVVGREESNSAVVLRALKFLNFCRGVASPRVGFRKMISQQSQNHCLWLSRPVLGSVYLWVWALSTNCNARHGSLHAQSNSSLTTQRFDWN